MALSSFMMPQGQQPQAQTVQPGPPAEWSPSEEYVGPSQLPIAVISIACGIVIVLLIAYVVYLQRSRWESMVNEGRKNLRRLTGNKAFPVLQDDLVERLDALEKALRQDATPANTPISQSLSSEMSSKLSLRSGDSSSTQGRKLSQSLSFRSPPAFPLSTNSSTIDENLLSEKSFYSQAGNSFNLLSTPLPIIQIHPVDSSMSIYSSFEQKSRPRSLSAPFPQPKRYSQLEDTYNESIPSRFILPEEPQPSFSSMLTRFTMDTLGEDVDDDVVTLNQAPSPTWGSPLPRTHAREAEQGPFDSSPRAELPSPPSTPEFNPSFEQLREQLDVVRRSAIFSTGSIHTPLDDIHEDIKRSYDVFLSMLDDGLFDSPENSPHTEHLRRVDPAIFRDSRADSFSAMNIAQKEFELGMDEEGAKEFNKRFISMLIDDLEHHTLKTSNSSRDLGEMSFPLRSQNPVISQLDNEDIPIACLEGLGPSPRSEASPNLSMGSSYPNPTPIFSSTRRSSSGSDTSSFTPRHNFVTRPTNTPVGQRSPPQMDRRSIVSARFSRIVSCPVRGDINLLKFDFGPPLDPGVFGFGRAAKWNPSDAPNNQLSGRRQSTASWSSQESMFKGNLGASHGPFATAPWTPFTPSSEMEHSKSLPDIDRDRRSRYILPPSPALPPGLGLAYPRSEIAYFQQRTSVGSAGKRRSIVDELTSNLRLSLASLSRFRGTELAPGVTTTEQTS